MIIEWDDTENWGPPRHPDGRESRAEEIGGSRNMKEKTRGGKKVQGSREM